MALINQTLRTQFVTFDAATGAPTNADSLPTGTLYRNGTAVGGATVTITNLGTGNYLASVALSSGDGWSVGDSYSLQASWSVGSNAFLQPLAQGFIHDDLAATLAAIKGGGWSTETLKGIYDLIGTRLASAGYTAPDNSGIATLLSRLSSGRAANLDNLDALVSSRLASGSYSAPPSAATIAAAVWDFLLSAAITVGSFGKLLKDNLDAAVGSRLSAAGYTAPDNSGISAIRTKTDAFLDATVSSRLATTGYTAPNNSGIAAIKAQTDLLDFDGDGNLQVNATAVVSSDTKNDIAAAVAAQLSGVKVTLVSPIASPGKLVLISGDDYYGSENRSIVFTDPVGNVWSDLSGATVNFVARNLLTPELDFSLAAAVDGQEVTVEIPKSAGSGVTKLNNQFRYFLEATLANGHKLTLAEGALVFQLRR